MSRFWTAARGCALGFRRLLDLTKAYLLSETAPVAQAIAFQTIAGLSVTMPSTTVARSTGAVPARSSGVGRPLLSVRRQIIGEMNPRQLVVNPSVVSRCHCRGLVEAANSNIDLLRVRPSHERQRRAAMRTERTQPPSPAQLSRLSGGEPKAASTERRPRHERCGTAPATI